MHGEEQRSDQSQSGVFKHTAFARVHEQAGHGAVQAHVDHVEIERRGAVQQDVQPVKKRGGIFSIKLRILSSCIKDMYRLFENSHKDSEKLLIE